MMPRKLTLQLTPLLDLLLIVIFAQFVEVREDQATTRAAMVEERDAAVARVDVLQDRLDRIQDEITRAEMEAARQKSLANQRSEQLEATRENLDLTIAQQRVLGELVVELFDIPKEEVSRVLNPTNRAGLRSQEDMEKLKEQFRELAMQKSGQMIKHLLSYEEIRKRCDVWDLHVDRSDTIKLTVGEKTYEVQIPLKPDLSVDKDRLLTDLYAEYRALPDPKHLVVILLTYDRQSLIRSTQAVREVLPELVARMQIDRAGQFRFEYADMGYRIE